MIFYKFMNEWLYGEDGYYRKFREIGKEGDFFTAVSMTPFFGGAIGNKIYKETKDKKDISIVEIGAHKGYMIVDIIRWIYTIDRDFLKRVKFFIIEKSKEVANIQREFFKEKLKGEVEVEILSSLSELKSNYAFFVSNEIFDAFGANLYYKEKIAYVKNWQIVWEDASKEDIEFAKRYNF
ncbi:MAG: hypothetical protein GXO02_05315, partial [Epsilonproteobacteria bacterium]|nr:hypothetical protein [Campylobacterota bacterium]